MSDLSKCCTCGFKWRAGQNGGHSCSTQMGAVIARLTEQLEQAKELTQAQHANIERQAKRIENLERYNEGLGNESWLRSERIGNLEDAIQAYKDSGTTGNQLGMFEVLSNETN